MPYVGAVVTAAALVGGGVVVANSAEAATVILPGFPDDPELAWDIRVNDAEWAVGDERNVYVAAPGVSVDLTAITVWDRDSGDFVRRFSTVKPSGDVSYYRLVLDGTILSEYCHESTESFECELVASDATNGDTLWRQDTSNTTIGIVGRSVVLNTGSRISLVDLRSGDDQASASGDYVYYETFRSAVGVRDGRRVEIFELPDLARPLQSLLLADADESYDLVGNIPVVSDGRQLLVGADLVEARRFESEILGLTAGSDEIVLVATNDGTTVVDLSVMPASDLWESNPQFVGALVGPSGSAMFSFEEELVFLDQQTGAPIASTGGCCSFSDGGIVLVEPERVWGFGYEEQDEVWSVDGLTTDSTFHLVDDGFVTIETDGTVRLYQ
jgi:hypothetical protein